MDILPLPHIDWTVRISDLILFGGGIWAFVKTFLAARDAQQATSRNVLTLAELSKEHDITLGHHQSLLAAHDKQIAVHQTWLDDLRSDHP